VTAVDAADFMLFRTLPLIVLLMGCLGIVVCAFSRPQTRNALSKNIVAQVRDGLVILLCSVNTNDCS